jgi:hypothetical protein
MEFAIAINSTDAEATGQGFQVGFRIQRDGNQKNLDLLIAESEHRRFYYQFQQKTGKLQR